MGARSKRVKGKHSSSGPLPSLRGNPQQSGAEGDASSSSSKGGATLYAGVFGGGVGTNDPNGNPQQELDSHRTISCVEKLFSADVGIMEEACTDISVFSLQAHHHAALMNCGVPSRLANILFYATSATSAEVSTDAIGSAVFTRIAAAEALRNFIVNSSGDALLDSLVGQTQEPNANFAVALSYAIHEFSQALEVKRTTCPLDLLVSEPHSSMDAAAAAAEEESEPSSNVGSEATGGVNPTHHNNNNNNRPVLSATPSFYLATGRLVEELLQLAVVCVEGNESAASWFTAPHTLNMLLSLLQSTAQLALQNVTHTANYFSEFSNAAMRGGDISQQQEERLERLRQFKRRETLVMASIAAAVAEVLHVMSGDNEEMVAFMSSTTAANTNNGETGSGAAAAVAKGITVEMQQMLNSLVDAQVVVSWWQETSTSSGNGNGNGIESSSSAGNEYGETGKEVALTREIVMCKLTRLSLHIDGMFVSCLGSAGSCQRVLPLLVCVLHEVRPVREWKKTLPFVVEDTGRDGEVVMAESERAMHVDVASQKLRCSQIALSVVQIVVEWICGNQSASEDDETSFARNPHAAMLGQSGILSALGELLRDVLFLPPTSTSSSSSSSSPLQNNNNNNNNNLMSLAEQQHAIRGAAAGNAEVTSLQFLFMSNEVGILGLSHTLLLMMPLLALGDVSSVWRAIIAGLQSRYQLLTEAAQMEAEDIAAARASQYGGGMNTEDGPSSAAARSVVGLSSSARDLMWLQMESLTQMAWTMQRKQQQLQSQQAQKGGILQAVASDVDVLTRLAHESNASATLKQATIGVVSLICLSFAEPEAVTVGARFCMAVLRLSLNITNSSTNNNNNSSNSNSSAASSYPLMWDDELFTSSLSACSSVQVVAGGTASSVLRSYEPVLALVRRMDELATVRSEAANALIDLFSEDYFDANVYAPLGVHHALVAFLPAIQGYVKRRRQAAKRLKTTLKGRVQNNSNNALAEVINDDGFEESLTHVEEVAENLEAFLAYKRKQMR